MQCSKCGGIGHSKSSSKCPLIGIAQEQNIEPTADLGDLDLGGLDLGGEESEIHSNNQDTDDDSDDLDETGVVLEDVIETTIVIDEENTDDVEDQCTTS